MVKIDDFHYMIAVMFRSSLKSWGMNCVGPSVLSFVRQWNLIRFAKFMAVPMHVNQHGVRGKMKVQNAHHEIFESVLGGFIKQHIQEKRRATLRYCNSGACQELQARQRGSVSVLFFWLMCISERTHPHHGNEQCKRRVNHSKLVFCGPHLQSPSLLLN